jgi:hypothetical protein
VIVTKAALVREIKRVTRFGQLTGAFSARAVIIMTQVHAIGRRQRCNHKNGSGPERMALDTSQAGD